MNANKQDAGGLPNELGFEQWYVTNTFDYPSNPLGSRDCSIARKAWHAALEAARDGELCRADPAGGEPNGKLVGWWNGITPGFDGMGMPSIRWGADAEDSRHDIPLYDGYNPIHYVTPVSAPAGGDSPVAEIGELNGTKLIVGRDEDALARLPKGTKLYTRPQDAAPAGGECQHEWAEDGDATAGRLFCRLCKIDKPASAPAGSGEVEQMAKRLDDARAIEEETSGLEDTIDAMRTAAALLRKLQQGAE